MGQKEKTLVNILYYSGEFNIDWDGREESNHRKEKI
jgi:hypothetical protein